MAPPTRNRQYVALQRSRRPRQEHTGKTHHADLVPDDEHDPPKPQPKHDDHLALPPRPHSTRLAHPTLLSSLVCVPSLDTGSRTQVQAREAQSTGGTREIHQDIARRATTTRTARRRRGVVSLFRILIDWILGTVAVNVLLTVILRRVVVIRRVILTEVFRRHGPDHDLVRSHR